MIRRTITHMKTRPRDERLAFAGMVAIGVVVVLFIGWAFFFLGSIREGTGGEPSGVATSSSVAE